uniref:EF-hand domain-containing protein D1-like n=1 Tax=Myxine glutinosa TaxID=7769 RepID=UPI00358F8899
MELKLMMEKLGAPQTHLNLKNMIMEVDEDFDGRLSFRSLCSGGVQFTGSLAAICRLLFDHLPCHIALRTTVTVLFLMIFHKAAAGKLQAESGLMALAMLAEIDVSVEGVKGAKDFFEAKL